MAINKTTLSGAVAALDTLIGVVSATGITAPVPTTGVGLTYLQIEQEMLKVTNLNGVAINVARGVLGTAAVAHASGAAVIVGGPADFPLFSPSISAVTISDPDRFDGFSAPVASATTITASGPRFHITGTTATATINLPPNFVQGRVTVVADGVWSGPGPLQATSLWQERLRQQPAP
jgi:hypothetical protein